MKQQLTKKAIRDSFLKLLAERSFDKITVKSIVEDCGLTRNTFYYYYEDTYDILDDILTIEIEKYAVMASRGMNIHDIVGSFCKYAEENQSLVNHVLRSTKWDEIKIYVLKAVERGADMIIDECAGEREIPAENRNIIKAVYRSAVGGLVEFWFQRGTAKGISEKLIVLNELFGDSMKIAVERSVKK